MNALRRWWAGIFPTEQAATIPDGTPLLTGDRLTEALIPLAVDLVAAVHADNRAVVTDLFQHAGALAGGPLAAARHLAVVLAAMCSEDHAPAATLGWTRNPREYRRLKAVMDSLTASLHAGREPVVRKNTA